MAHLKSRLHTKITKARGKTLQILQKPIVALQKCHEPSHSVAIEFGKYDKGSPPTPAKAVNTSTASKKPSYKTIKALIKRLHPQRINNTSAAILPPKVAAFGTHNSPQFAPGDDPIFGPINRISATSVEELAMSHAPAGVSSAKVLRFTNGANNRVAMVEYDNNEKICVRIPACGWGKKWTEADKATLRNSALAMNFIKKHTSVPVPAAVVFDTGMENPIGAPYMIVEHIDGVTASSVWFPDHGDDVSEFFSLYGGRKLCPVDDETERKRQNTLRTLAQSMSELSRFKFDKLGLLTFPIADEETPSIIEGYAPPFGQSERLDDEDPDMFPDGHTKIWTDSVEKLRLTLAHMRTAEAQKLQEKSKSGENTSDYAQQDLHGLFRFWCHLLNAMPYSSNTQSSSDIFEWEDGFVLAPPDLNEDNVLVDNDGNVVGIIDWDRLETQPRYHGFASPPQWICHDMWGSEYYDWPNNMISADQSQIYRGQYAQYLKDACPAGVDDWRYTTVGHLYSQIVSSVGDLDRMKQLMDRLLEMVMPGMDLDILYRECSHEDTPMENFWRIKFADLLGTTMYEELDDENMTRVPIQRTEPRSLFSTTLHQLIPSDGPRSPSITTASSVYSLSPTLSTFRCLDDLEISKKQRSISYTASSTTPSKAPSSHIRNFSTSTSTTSTVEPLPMLGELKTSRSVSFGTATELDTTKEEDLDMSKKDSFHTGATNTTDTNTDDDYDDDDDVKDIPPEFLLWLHRLPAMKLRKLGLLRACDAEIRVQEEIKQEQAREIDCSTPRSVDASSITSSSSYQCTEVQN